MIGCDFTNTAYDVKINSELGGSKASFDTESETIEEMDGLRKNGIKRERGKKKYLPDFLK